MSHATKSVLLGGIGGVLPKTLTLAVLLTSNTANEIMHTIPIGFYFGILLFFFIGAVMSFAVVEKDRKIVDYLFAGIAAPSLIISIGSGIDSASAGYNATSIWDHVITKSYANTEMAHDSLGEYKYVIKSFPVGSNDFRPNTLNYDLIVDGVNGEKEKVSISGNKLQYDIDLSFPISKIILSDNSGNALKAIEIGEQKSGEIILQPKVQSELDLFWVLGSKGKANVVGGDVQFLPNKED